MPSTRYQKINAHHYRHIWAVGDIHGDYGDAANLLI